MGNLIRKSSFLKLVVWRSIKKFNRTSSCGVRREFMMTL